MTGAEWLAAQSAINKWLRRGGRAERCGPAIIAAPARGELTDVDREELEGHALEAWAVAAGAITAQRAAARALDAWRGRRARRGDGAHLSLDEAFKGRAGAKREALVGASPEDLAIADIDASRQPTPAPAGTKPPPTGKAAEGPGSRAVQADCFVRQCSQGDPARALRWLRCLPAVASMTLVPEYGGAPWSEEARAAALDAIRAALAQSSGKAPALRAKAVLRALGAPKEAAKSLDAHLRMQARRGAA